MNRLWAPWRMKYIKNIGLKKDDGCVFCSAPADNKDRENLILHRGLHTFIIMNLYPYNNGHLMVVPYKHTSDCSNLDTEITAELWKMLMLCKQALNKALKPEGFNIGMNIGRTAGAGIDQHVHMHIVPRWNGDTNFMPVTGECKIISQGLFDTYDLLSPIFAEA